MLLRPLKVPSSPSKTGSVDVKNQFFWRILAFMIKREVSSKDELIFAFDEAFLSLNMPESYYYKVMLLKLKMTI